MSFTNDGYTTIKNFLDQDQVEDFRNTIDSYLQHNKSYNETGDSKILPGFAGNTPELKSLNVLHRDHTLMRILGNVFQTDDFIFLEHSDLHQNKTTGWHRDTKDYERGGGHPQDTWADDYFIVKACLLLQDHTDNQYGLWFKPGTHRLGVDSREIHANTQSTDLIIFDQRILHRGQVNTVPYHKLYNKNRYLITYGYGLNNKHSELHKLGATKRQEQQRNTYANS
jgi:hypothetical protein